MTCDTVKRVLDAANMNRKCKPDIKVRMQQTTAKHVHDLGSNIKVLLVFTQAVFRQLRDKAYFVDMK